MFLFSALLCLWQLRNVSATPTSETAPKEKTLEKQDAVVRIDEEELLLDAREEGEDDEDEDEEELDEREDTQDEDDEEEELDERDVDDDEWPLGGLGRGRR